MKNLYFFFIKLDTLKGLTRFTFKLLADERTVKRIYYIIRLIARSNHVHNLVFEQRILKCKGLIHLKIRGITQLHRVNVITN